MSSTLTYDAVPASRLSPEQVAAWNALVDASTTLASPFFRPEYTQTVAEVRDDIQVCIISNAGRTVGFYPFERIQRFRGRPVGGPMSNFQGVVTANDTPWSAADLVRGAGLKTLHFHHQVDWQSQFEPAIERRVASPQIDFGSGWEEYVEGRRRAGGTSFNALARKMRKLEREVGAITFVPHTTDSEVLDRLVAWKRAQYLRTGTTGSISTDWAVEVLRRLMRVQDEGFRGMLSALYAGDRLIAAHAGICSASVWHYWFPAYDRDVGQHSPGLVLMHEMARSAANAGLTRIDLGPGEGAHKDLFATSATSICTGEVVVSAAAHFVSRLRNRLRATRRS